METRAKSEKTRRREWGGGEKEGGDEKYQERERASEQYSECARAREQA